MYIIYSSIVGCIIHLNFELEQMNFITKQSCPKLNLNKIGNVFNVIIDFARMVFIYLFQFYEIFVYMIWVGRNVVD